MPSDSPLQRDDARERDPAGGANFERALTLTLAVPSALAVLAVAVATAALLGRRAVTPAGAWGGGAAAGVLVVACALALWWACRRGRALARRYRTARARAEQQAQEAAAGQSRLAGIIASAMDAIITLDHAHRVVVFNAAAERIFGWTSSEMLGRPLDRLLPRGLRDAHRAHVQAFAETGVSTRSMGQPGRLTALRRDGTEFPIEATISQVGEGAERLLTVILRDVSERARAEDERHRQAEQLAQYARRLEGLQEIDRAILAATRLDELLVAALVRFAPLVGADEVDVSLAGAHGDTRQHRVVTRGVPQARVIAHPAGGEQSVEEWIISRGGLVAVDDLHRAPSAVPVLVSLRAKEGLRSYVGTVLVAGQQPVGRLECWASAPGVFGEAAHELVGEVATQLAIAIEQAQLREDLHRYAEDLEARVEQRTRALEEVNAELNAFAYSVSHDLRAPLRSMQGFGEALLEDHAPALDATGQDYARRIVAAARRMDALIQDLLAYSRLSRRDLELQPVDTQAVAEGIVALVREQAAPASPRIEIDGPLPPVVGHAGVLAQVLQNLVGNAVKFVAPGTLPHVRIAAERRGDRVVLSVTDNGIGVPAEYHGRIFRVFERLHPLDAYPGTGIGLAIVRKGVDRMGGECGLESLAEGGTRFWVDLPAASRPAAAAPEAMLADW